MKELRFPRSPAGRPDGARGVSWLVGRGLSAAVSRLVERCARRQGASRIVIVHDRRLPSGPLESLLAALGLPRGRRAGRARSGGPLLIALPGGEAIKTREAKARLEDRLLAAGCGRDTLLVAIGGGSLLDLAGFTAATYARGIEWVALPTTLLAMADASIGGKTAINVPAGKNLIGALHHPLAIACDLRWLDGLGRPRLADGFAEIVKIAVARSLPLFELIERIARSGGGALRPRSAGFETVLLEAARLKAAVVAADEREAGLRQVLNLGHTLAHAIEAEAMAGPPGARAMTPRRITHGRAVSIGIVFACRLAERANGFDPESTRRVRRVLELAGLPVEIPSRFPRRRLLARIRSDKKARGGQPRWVLPLRLGRLDRCGGRWSRPLDPALVCLLLADCVEKDTPHI